MKIWEILRSPRGLVIINKKAHSLSQSSVPNSFSCHAFCFFSGLGAVSALRLHRNGKNLTPAFKEVMAC